MAALGDPGCSFGRFLAGHSDHQGMSSMPACYKCGAAGAVPLRKHQLALCEGCYREALHSTVGTEAEPVPA